MVQIADMMKTFAPILLLCFFVANTTTSTAQKFFKKHPQINPYNYQLVKEAEFEHAAVTSAHPLASMVGASIMQDGGNAYDAAIAMQFSLAVVHPGAGNIGGGGFMLSRNVDGQLIGIDFREAAPSKGHRDMYLDEKGNPSNTLSRDGASASGIPGSVAGMFEMLQYATLPMAKLIQPAIELAAHGYVLTEKEARGLNATKPQFLKNSSAPSAFTQKEQWKVGDTLIQTDLANTLKRIQKKGLA